MIGRRPFGGWAGGEPPLKPDDYRLIRDLVRDRLGVWFGPEQRASLERRLRERLTVRGVSSFGDYYQLLRYGTLAADEWEEASDLLTTHETYFFREDYQLRAFSNELLPMFAERSKGKRLHVWSAGCSSGEEAYTIAMLVLESSLFEGASDIRIYGSDLSRRCIKEARYGVYPPSSFRTTSDTAKKRWFAREAGGFGVAPAVRTLCHFGQMNLLDGERTSLVGRCDVIFCRNVMLYFDPAARRRVIDMFYERLVPGGVLLLGHAESLLNVSTAFELLHLSEDLVYRKPLTAPSR